MRKGYIRGWEPRKNPLDSPADTDFIFTANQEKAYAWASQDEAESERRMFDSYRIRIPSAFGGTHICKEFRVEERESGDFVIFCVAPFISPNPQ